MKLSKLINRNGLEMTTISPGKVSETAKRGLESRGYNFQDQAIVTDQNQAKDRAGTKLFGQMKATLFFFGYDSH